MSFFNRSARDTPPPSNAPNSGYSRLPPNPSYNMPPANPRMGQRVPPPRAENLYEKRSVERASSPYGYRGASASSAEKWVQPTLIFEYSRRFDGYFSSYLVVSCPSNVLALTNRIIMHPASGFRDGDHVLVKDNFPMTVKYAVIPARFL